MKITKVSYQKAYIIGPYLQEKVGFEAELDYKEDEKIVLNALKIMADEWHKENNPHLYEEKEEWIPGTEFPEHMKTKITFEKSSPMPIIDRSSKEKLEIAIDNADSLETLSTLKEEASKHGLVSQYMSKLKSLTNGNKDEV